jgi:hypothetical protein
MPKKRWFRLFRALYARASQEWLNRSSGRNITVLPDVFGRKERVLGVLAGDSGALPLLVVQKLGHDEERGLM